MLIEQPARKCGCGKHIGQIGVENVNQWFLMKATASAGSLRVVAETTGLPARRPLQPELFAPVFMIMARALSSILYPYLFAQKKQAEHQFL